MATLSLATFGMMALGGLSVASADRAAVHIVQPGETLASVAERYYGDTRYERVLVAHNQLGEAGELVIGMRLDLPTLAYHQVDPGETWAMLAQRFYGDPRRGFVLWEGNGITSGEPPDEGAELVVPYPLRHVATQQDTLRSIAKTYYGQAGDAEVIRLRRFNFLRRSRIQRGQVILVPLADLKYSEAGRTLVAEATAHAGDGARRQRQSETNDHLPTLRDHIRSGRYAEAIAMGGQLLGRGELTSSQVVTIQRELATAFVALGRDDLATQAFREALRRQPFMELDTTRTSPKVLRAFSAARSAHAAETDHTLPALAHPDAGTAHSNR